MTCHDLENNKGYDSHNIPGILYADSRGLTPEGCRALCQQYPDCVGWSWYPADHPHSPLDCFIKTKLGVSREVVGSVSGQRDCKGNYLFLYFTILLVLHKLCAVVLVQEGPTIRNTFSPKQVCPTWPPCQLQPSPSPTVVFLPIRNRMWPSFGRKRVASAWYQTSSLVGKKEHSSF